jgi:hypothetical protein
MKAVLEGALKVALAKGTHVEDLPMDTDSITGTLGKIINTLQDLKRVAEAVKKNDLKSLASKVQQSKEEIETVEKQFQEQHAALQFKITQQSKENRSAYTTAYWDGTKVCTAFLKGGTGEGHCDIFGRGVFNQMTAMASGKKGIELYSDRIQFNPSADDFDVDHLAIFDRAPEMLREMFEYWDSIQNKVREKDETLRSHIELYAYKGCLGDVDATMPSVTTGIFKEAFQTVLPGGSMWGSAFKNNALRGMSAKQVCVPGMAALHFGPLDGFVDLHIHQPASVLKRGFESN